MAGSNEPAKPERIESAPTSRPRRPRPGLTARRFASVAVALGAIGVALYLFPLFRVVPLRPAGNIPGGAAGGFDPRAFAAEFWTTRLQPAAARASDAPVVVAALRRDPATAAREHGHRVGLGATYFFLHGRGRVVQVESNRVVIELAGAAGAQLVLRRGPVFGNAVRDGTGLLNLNAFPGLQEFNALAAELNQLVESRVVPLLRDPGITAGVNLEFAGVAEAPESLEPGPLLTLVPIHVAILP